MTPEGVDTTPASVAGAAGGTAGGAAGGGRHRGIAVLRVAIPVALSAWIVSLVDWGAFWTALTAARPGAIAAAGLLLVTGLTISAYKWQRLLRLYGLRYRLRRLVGWYLVATFFNHLLPTSIGGDGYRIYKTWRNDRGRTASVMVIVLERVTGVLALGLLAYGSALFLYLSSRDPLAGWVVAAGSVAVPAAALGLWVGARWRVGERLADRPGRVGEWAGVVVRLLGDVRRQPGRLAEVIGISFLFHANRIMAVWLLLLGLGAVADPLELTVAMFAVDIAGIVPLSLGGLGLIEGSFMLAMGHFGVAEELSLAAMLLLRVLLLPLALIGAVLYLRGDRLGAPSGAEGPAPGPTRGSTDRK